MKILTFAMLFGVSVGFARTAISISDPKYMLPQYDAAVDLVAQSASQFVVWDWSDPVWFRTHADRTTNFQALPDPWSPQNHVGVSVDADHCAYQDGWRLFARRILSWDDVPKAADPNDPRSNPGFTDGLVVNPFFVLYNINTGVLRNFVYLSPEASLFPAGKYVTAHVSIANQAGATENSEKIPYLQHAVFANHPTTGSFTPLSKTAEASQRVMVASGVPYVKGKWLVFDVDVSYDPGIKSSSAVLYYYINLQFSDESKIDLNVDASLKQTFPETPDAAKVSIFSSLSSFKNFATQGYSIIKSESKEIKSNIEGFQEVTSDISSTLDRFAKRETWRSKKWENPEGEVETSIRGAADAGGSIANWLNGVASIGWLKSSSPVVGGILSFASSVIAGSTSKPNPPVPLSFSVSGKIGGSLTWQSSGYPYLSNMLGTSAVVGGMNGSNPSMYPLYGKMLNGVSLGIVGIKRSPKATIIAARPRSMDVPDWYAVIEDPASLVELNPAYGYRVRSSGYRFVSKGGAYSALVRSGNIHPISLAVPIDGNFERGSCFEKGGDCIDWIGLDERYHPNECGSRGCVIYKHYDKARKKFGGWWSYFENPTVEVWLDVENNQGGSAVLKYVLDLDYQIYDPADALTSGWLCPSEYKTTLFVGEESIDKILNNSSSKGLFMPWPTPAEILLRKEKAKKILPAINLLLE